jgi:hypothetical protein
MVNDLRRWIWLIEAAGMNPLDQDGFKRWFGSSKVVDEHGAPMVVYHGTTGDIDHFNAAKIGKTDPGYLGKGFYFGSKGDANVYAGKYMASEGGNVVPVYLSLQNPLQLQASFEGRREVDREVTVRHALRLPRGATADQVTQTAKAAGHDGVTYDRGGEKEFVAFDPHQIKSAIGNRGTFDPNDSRITEAVFTEAPLKQMIWGNQRAHYGAFKSDEPVPIYYRLSASEMYGLMKECNLRTVITLKEVYVADSATAAHAGMRSVLRQYGVDTSDSINTIITGNNRMVYAFGKYNDDAGQHRKWNEIRNFVLNHPRIKIMFPKKLVFVRDEWT